MSPMEAKDLPGPLKIAILVKALGPDIGDVILSGLQPRIVEIFEMVGFDMLFDVYPDLDSALTARPTSG